MCGIAGTVFSADFNYGIEVSLNDFKNALQKIENKDGSEALLDLAWQYKSNINFIRFCKKNSERKKLIELCESIKNHADKKRNAISLIDKSQTLEPYKHAVKEYENIMDAHWFLSEEIYRWVETIEEISGELVANLSDENLVLYKDICKVIHAIDNRLELRGRDSLGISIVISSSESTNLEKEPIENKDESYYFFKENEKETHTFTFKTCNSIGGLGDNADEIKKLFLDSKYINTIIKNTKVFSATIMAHTRWASVGAVKIENAHPTFLTNNSKEINNQILSLLNGDIYNYKEIISSAKTEHTAVIERSKCTNDSLAIPAYLLGKDKIDLDLASKMSNDFSGSFAIAIQNTLSPEKITLLKKGIQGLYLGFSYDGIMFASDVYGLVESCKYFVPIDTDSCFEINAIQNHSKNNLSFSIFNSKNESYKSIDKDDLQITNITTRDIDKRGYKHFLEKEIYETHDIVERTINAYLQPLDFSSIDKNNLFSSISMNEQQVPAYITENIKEKKIKKIIITGMGTCYTAAVAISMYMRDRLKIFIPNIIVEPHVASEGSAFYVESNMQDTLVIVIAQSGTTVDTNVYVQMAKERGAMSLAIANKREGDVTFIVDGTIYIGEGRDIEIAVPSTKTYTAQVILGYILTLYLVSNLLKSDDHINLFLRDLKDLKESNTLINKSFKKIEEVMDFDKLTNFGCIKNSWYVFRDSSSNSVCADELRIKYSENCYQSVSSITINDGLSLGVKNSFITFITEKEISKYYTKITELCSNNNLIIIICINSETSSQIKSLEEEGKVLIINMPKSRKHFSFLPTVIAGQFLSYYLAVAIDKRKEMFVDLFDSIDDSNKTKEHLSKFKNSVNSGIFNQGFSYFDIKRLFDKYSEKNMSIPSVKKQLNFLIEQSRRTIDTIKHQAKTITVGAVRENIQGNTVFNNSIFNADNQESSNDYDFIKDINIFFNKFIQNKNKFDCKKEILVAHKNLDESYAYNVVNFLNDILNKYDSEIKVRLAHDYDLLNKNKTLFNWILLKESNDEEILDTTNSIDTTNLFIFTYDSSKLFLENFSYIQNLSSQELERSLWSLILSIFISNKLIDDNSINLNNDETLPYRIKSEFNKHLHNLNNVLNNISLSQEISNSIRYAARTYLTRNNWKCIGSGINYNLSKYASKRLIKEIGRACAFDVLENHKHIDMSAESAIVVFISNIWKHGYQEDAFAEIEKLISHNSLPIIITNEGDDRYDNFSMLIEQSYNNFINLPVPLIKLPKVEQQFSFVLNVYVVEKFIEEIKYFVESKNLKNLNVSAVKLASTREEI
jgi:glucosamine 6-phosphate synthetase-like amidotransferase/phosphosugar isomerase protein